MLSIGIISLNNFYGIQLTLARLRNLNIEHEIIIYDQGSSDGTINYLQALNKEQILNSILHINESYHSS